MIRWVDSAATGDRTDRARSPNKRMTFRQYIYVCQKRGHYLASLIPAAVRRLDDTFHAWVLTNQRASFPPSTAMEAPEMKAALSDARNTMVWAISSGVPTRFIGTPEIKAAFFAAVPVNRFSI